jgi:hypothetical protein
LFSTLLRRKPERQARLTPGTGWRRGSLSGVSLSGPVRTIVVEPVRAPVEAPAPAPQPVKA